MNNFDRIMLGSTMFAFSLSMLAISLEAFNIAGIPFKHWTLILLGVVAGLVMLAFLIGGFFIFFSKRFQEKNTDNKNLKSVSEKKVVHYIEMENKNIKIKRICAFVFMVTIAAILLMLYLCATDYIETKKLYPEGNNFYFVTWYYSNNNSCIVTYPSSVFYSNAPAFFKYSNDSFNSKNYMEYDLFLREQCDFKNVTIVVSGKDISHPIYYEVYKDNNYSSANFSNKDEYNLYKISLKYEPYKNIKLRIVIPVNNSFYNYYSFGQGVSGDIKFNRLTFLFKNDWRSGYYADENAFSITDGEVKKEMPVSVGSYKEYTFNDVNSITMRFSPKSKFWSLIQKAADAIILGLIAVLIYDAFKLLEVKQNKISNQRIRYRKWKL